MKADKAKGKEEDDDDDEKAAAASCRTREAFMVHCTSRCGQ
jgi:hypothetical protein